MLGSPAHHAGASRVAPVMPAGVGWGQPTRQTDAGARTLPSLAGPPVLPVGISLIANFDYQNVKHSVLNIANDPIVTYAVMPVPGCRLVNALSILHGSSNLERGCQPLDLGAA